MRSYIFTSVEKDSIQLFLQGRIRRSDPRVAYILSRMRSFSRLSGDVDLYLRLREAATTAAELLREAATASSA